MSPLYELLITPLHSVRSELKRLKKYKKAKCKICDPDHICPHIGRMYHREQAELYKESGSFIWNNSNDFKVFFMLNSNDTNPFLRKIVNAPQNN